MISNLRFYWFGMMLMLCYFWFDLIWFIWILSFSDSRCQCISFGCWSPSSATTKPVASCGSNEITITWHRHIVVHPNQSHHFWSSWDWNADLNQFGRQRKTIATTIATAKRTWNCISRKIIEVSFNVVWFKSKCWNVSVSGHLN